MTSRSNQARTPGNVRAPRAAVRDNRTDPRVVHERRSTDCKDPNIAKYLGRSVVKIKPRGREVNGVVRQARVGVAVFLINVTDEIGGRSFTIPKKYEADDLLDSFPGENRQVKLAAIDALLVGAEVSVNLVGSGTAPGIILSKEVKDLFVVRYGNKEVETLDSEALDKIITPFGRKGPVEKIIEELEGDQFRVKWRSHEEEEVVPIEDLADSVVWEYRLAQLTPTTSHPHNPDLRKGYKKHKEATLVHRPEPKHHIRLVDDAKEQERMKRGTPWPDPSQEARCGWEPGLCNCSFTHTHSFTRSFARLALSLARFALSLVLSFSIPYRQVWTK